MEMVVAETAVQVPWSRSSSVFCRAAALTASKANTFQVPGAVIPANGGAPKRYIFLRNTFEFFTNCLCRLQVNYCIGRYRGAIIPPPVKIPAAAAWGETAIGYPRERLERSTGVGRTGQVCLC